METLVKDEAQAAVKTAENATTHPDRHDEIDELMRIKRTRRIEAGRVPCPSCTVPVEMTINRCPFCDSDIAAETALARETTRRLRELSGEFDAEHAARPEEEGPQRRGFFQRLKYLFEGDPEPVAPPTIDPHAKRLLSNVSPGDTLKVLDEDGPWLKVKTAGGDIGWVYSTVRKGR
ncbi:MAG TPA: SH3 domain-containing protein [Candidatus Krumholzibacteria bacterium]|nr:SH3 domain-containing protein [Candidatus Krumholzibacteria bacterium]